MNATPAVTLLGRLVVVALFLAGGQSYAQTFTDPSQSFSNLGSATVPFNFATFNSSLGTLDSVEVILENVTLTGSASGTNKSRRFLSAFAPCHRRNHPAGPGPGRIDRIMGASRDRPFGGDPDPALPSPPGPGRGSHAYFLCLFLGLALSAFLPAGWGIMPEWRRHLTVDLNAPLGDFRTPQPWLTLQACGLLLFRLVWTYYLLRPGMEPGGKIPGFASVRGRSDFPGGGRDRVYA
jgi:hypothetical protein